MGRATWLLITFIILTIASATVCAATPNDFNVVIVHTGKTKAVNDYSDSLKDKLSNAYFQDVDISKYPLPHAKEVDLFVASGRKALDYLISKEVSAPILSVFLSRLSYLESLKLREKINNKQISAIYSDPDPSLLIHLSKILFPKNTTVAFVVSDTTEFLRPILEKSAAHFDVDITFSKLTDDHSLYKELNNLSNADVLLAMPDSRIFNKRSLSNILRSTYRHEQALIGYSKGMVKAGALASPSYSVKDIVNESVRFINQYLGNGILPKATYSQLFDIEINDRVAKTFNISLRNPEEIRRRLRASPILSGDGQ